MAPRHHVALDGWRGVAALMTALFHFASASPISATPLVRNSWLFVDFFFVLSGFVIAANYQRRIAEGSSVPAFLALRVGRLYPLHLFVLALFVATELAFLLLPGLGGGITRQAFTGQTSMWALTTNLFLVQGMGLHDTLTWNGAAWSISTEMWAYVTFGLVVMAFGRNATPVFLALIAIALVFCLPETLRPAGTRPFVEFARCIYGFSMGVLLNRLYEQVAVRNPLHGVSTAVVTALEVAALALAVGFVIWANELPAHLLAPLAFAPAVLIYAFDRGTISRFLQTRPMVALGILSYSVYMMHGFLQSRVMLPAAVLIQKQTGLQILSPAPAGSGINHVFGTDPFSGTFHVVLMLVLVVAASAVTYRLIEAPGRDAMRRLVNTGGRRQPVPS